MKHRYFWVLAIAASLVFTQCIDNDEPQGLQQMREAKAELLSAQATMQLAEAEYKKAQVLTEQALARYRAAEAEALEITNAIESARNDQEKKKMELELERLMEKQKADLAWLKEKTADCEGKYQKALIDLEAIKALYADSKYAPELAKVVKELGTSRGQITGLRNQIITKQGLLFSYISKDSLTINRRLRTAVADAEKDYALGQEKVDLLKKALESSTARWGATRDQMKARMEELKTAWDDNFSLLAKELSNKQKDKYIELVNLIYSLTGNYSAYSSDMSNKDLKPEEQSIMEKRYEHTISFTVPASLSKLFESYFPSFKKSANGVYANEYIGLQNSVSALKYAENGNGKIHYDEEEFPEGWTVGGMIPQIKSWKLSANDLANANQTKTQYETKVAAAKAAYEADLAKYQSARDKFTAAAEAYGYDWTGTNNDEAAHLWTSTNKAVKAFYEAYDKKIMEDPAYVPAEAELKTVAAQIANYLKKRVALTGYYDLDPLMELDPLNPEERLRLSAALTATVPAASDFRLNYLITAGMGRTVMGWSENLDFYPNETNPDPTKYESTLADIVEAGRTLYGLNNHLMPIDLDPEKDFTVKNNYASDSYTQINPYYYSVELIVPITHLYIIGSSTATESLYELTSGSLYEYLTNREAAADLGALIAAQADVEKLAEAAEKQYASLLADYRAGLASHKAIVNEYNDLYTEYADYIHTHELRTDDQGNLTVTTDLSLAEKEYAYCQDMYDRLDSYITKGDITLDGKDTPYTDIEQDIETAEEAVAQTTVGGLYEALEQAKAALAAWIEFGYNNGVAAQGDKIRAEIADLETKLSDEMKNFEYLTGLKDKIVGLMKTE